MMVADSLLVGIGSAVGDDAVGWALAQRLGRQTLPPQMLIRLATSPADLLGWLDGIDRLVVCDAIVGTSEIGKLLCWRWPVPEIELERFAGSHDMTLPAVLELASVLGQLPGEVRVVGVTIGSTPAIRDPGDESPLSDAVRRSLPALERQLLDQLWRWHHRDVDADPSAAGNTL
jgi:hydrogenase maturation protease